MLLLLVSGIIVILLGLYELGKWTQNLVQAAGNLGYSAGLVAGFGTGHNAGSSGIDRKRIREVNRQLVILPECCLDLRLIPRPECDTCKYLENCKDW